VDVLDDYMQAFFWMVDTKGVNMRFVCPEHGDHCEGCGSMLNSLHVAKSGGL
jgi:hypothetical protein